MESRSKVKKSKWKRKMLALSVVILFALVIGVAQYWANGYKADPMYSTSLSPELMKQDVDYLVELLKKYHPNFESDGKSYEESIYRIYDEIKTSKTLEQFYWIMDDLFVAVKDAHTHMNFIGQNGIMLPSMVWTKDGLIVRKAERDFKVGDKIVSIGGKTPEFILNSMNGMIPAEVPEWVKANFMKISNELYLRHLGLVDADNRVVVEYEREGNIYRDILALRRSYQIPWHSFVGLLQKDYRPISWKLDTANMIGILTINECGTTKDFSKTMEKFFRAVSKNKLDKIIVDLRQNDGGSDQIINLFVSYLDKESYYGLYSNTPSVIINDPKWYRQVDEKSPSLYKGKVYIFTSNATFSAAVDFTTILKGNGMALVIGQPAGNIPAFCGNGRQGRLPACGIGFQYATTRFKAPVPENEQDRAIIPDFEVEISRDNLEQEEDPWMIKFFNIMNEQGPIV